MTGAIGAVVVWAAGWWLNVRLANGPRSDTPVVRALIPAIFGITVIITWELLVWAYNINPVILPSPSSIGARMVVEGPRLWADFQQTIIKGAMSGYIIGGLAAFGVAILAPLKASPGVNGARSPDEGCPAHVLVMLDASRLLLCCAILLSRYGMAVLASLEASPGNVAALCGTLRMWNACCPVAPGRPCLCAHLCAHSSGAAWLQQHATHALHSAALAA